MDQKSERDLVTAAKDGDEQAMAAIYAAYAAKIYRYLYYRVENQEIAEDLTADVFLQFIQGLSTYEYQNVPLLAWLYRIAHARLVDYYRRRERAGEQQDIEKLNLIHTEDFDGNLMSNYEQREVRAALDKLPYEQQRVIMLRFVQGLSLQTTAEVLGKTIDTVKTLQRRALRGLSRALKKNWYIVL